MLKKQFISLFDYIIVIVNFIKLNRNVKETVYFFVFHYIFDIFNFIKLNRNVKETVYFFV